MRLAERAEADGVGLTFLPEVGSTNAIALGAAREGTKGPHWFVATRQTAGRGRRGRAWISEPGNVYASLLLTDQAPAKRAAELSFVAALAVHDALAAIAPAFGTRVSLKWPNDVLLDGAKIAGILIEGESVPGRSFAAAVGIGVNCAHHPDAVGNATSLAASGHAVLAADMFAALSLAMWQRLREWNAGDGFAAIRQSWLARAAGIGLPIRVRTADAEMHGIFAALDPDGRLVLDGFDGTKRLIAAGEVFPLLHPPATAALA